MWQHQSGYWYSSIISNGKKKVFSLKTKDKAIAIQNNESFKNIKSQERTHRKTLDFKILYKLFLNNKKEDWSDKTYTVYRSVLSRHARGIKWPMNKQSRYTWSNHINSCLLWGYKQGLTDKPMLFRKGKKHYRNRVYSKAELELLFKSPIRCKEYRLFLRFAYYTGARRGELCNIQSVYDDYMVVKGKSDQRIVRLNTQSRQILLQISLPNVRPDSVTQRFNRYVDKLGIIDGRFHDLRRTFGFNLIRKGMSIYEVSKLLGHESVHTTEKHYAPLQVRNIKEFTL
jgi:integrase|tara:strand:- start:652 stop:1506 length:855 start_codon:yes stop_codon:yes gene_type:complete